MVQQEYLIVFVDDEPNVCKAVSQILTRFGYEVCCFASAEESLRFFKQKKVHLLITDVNLGPVNRMNGIDLLLEVKKMQPSLPVLIVTGYGDIPLAIRAIKGGAEDFIEKPLNGDTLLPAIKSLLCETVRADFLKGTPLTGAEASVLRLILQGKNNREIAETMNRAVRTIEDHRRRVMRKLGAKNVVQLVQLGNKIDFSRYEGRE